jgi:hypothetical protein
VNAVLQQRVPFRARRSMAAAAFGERLYFFGGVGSATGTESILDVANDLWCFDTRDLSWREVPLSAPWPPARRCAGWTSHDGGLVLWGGSGICRTPEGATRYTFLNDVWRFIPATERWELVRETDDHRVTPADSGEAAAHPFPRYTPVWQSVGGELFLFSGYTEDRLGKRKLNDAWICRGTAWRRIPPGPRQDDAGAGWPGPRYGCMSACDSRSVYVCGGVSDAGDHIDLWRFDMAGQAWEQLSPDADGPGTPAPRYCAAMTVHGGEVFVFGGRSRIHPKRNFNDLWAFDLAARIWRQVQENREPHRYDESAEFPGYHAKAATAVVGRDWYLWGGEGRRGHVSDFWTYSFADGRWRMLSAARSDDPCFW